MSKVNKWVDKKRKHIENQLSEGIKGDFVEIYNDRDRLEDIQLKSYEVSRNFIPGEQLTYGLQSTSKKVQTGEDAFPVYYVLDVPDDNGKVPEYVKILMDKLKEGKIPFSKLHPLLDDLITKLQKTQTLVTQKTDKTYVLHLASADPLSADLARYIGEKLSAPVYQVPKITWSLDNLQDVLDDMTTGDTALDILKNVEYETEPDGKRRLLKRSDKPGKPFLPALDSPYRTDAEAKHHAFSRYNRLVKSGAQYTPRESDLIELYGKDKIARFKDKSGKIRPIEYTDPVFLAIQSMKTAESRDKADYPTDDFKTWQDFINWKMFSAINTRHRILRYMEKLKSKGMNNFQISKKLRGMNVNILKSKYDFGFYPDLEGTFIGKYLEEDGLDDLVAQGEISEVQKAIIQGLRSEATVIIVDDNINTGADFRKIGQGLMNVKEEMIELGQVTGIYLDKDSPLLFRHKIGLKGKVASFFTGVVMYKMDPLLPITKTSLKSYLSQDKKKEKAKK